MNKIKNMLLELLVLSTPYIFILLMFLHWLYFGY